MKWVSYALVGMTALLIVFSLLPLQPLSRGAGIGRSGDLEHVVAYGIYSVLWVITLKKRLLGFGMAVAVGIMIEVLQTAVPYRTADVLDIGFNALGAGIGVLTVAIKSSQYRIKYENTSKAT